METKQLLRPPTTSKDRQRLAESKFGAKSSNLNEDFERPLTTMKTVKDTKRPPATGSDFQRPRYSKDRERPSTTLSDYIETRL